MSALDKQEGGDHYRGYAIQPVEFITVNDLGFLEGCVIKRMCRWQMKGGVQDLRKAIHEIELLIEQTEISTKRADAERQSREKLAAHLGHPMTGDRMTLEAEKAVSAELAKRERIVAMAETADRERMSQFQAGTLPLGAVTRPPLAGSERPAYCLPEGAFMPPPGVLEDGTRVLVWRRRDPGAPGHVPYGWVEYGYVQDGRLVPYAEG